MSKRARLDAEMIIKCYCDNNYNKTKAAEALGMTDRGFKIKFLRIKADYPDIFEPLLNIVSTPDEYFCSWMPTNEERINHLDR